MSIVFFFLLFGHFYTTVWNNDFTIRYTNTDHGAFCRKNRRRGRAVGAGNRDLQKAAEGQDRVHSSTAGRAGEVVFGVPVPGHSSAGESGREVWASRTSSTGQQHTDSNN